jgi:hypothetical protein
MKPVLLGVSLIAAGSLAAQTPGRPTLADVAWLQGCWRAHSPQRTVEENWTAAAGGTMIGVSRTVRGDSLADFELVILRQRDSTLEYEAHPARQPVATFTARAASPTGVIFENPMHDFPQRVGYRRVSADSLIAYVEGAISGRSRRIEFPYARAVCAGS